MTTLKLSDPVDLEALNAACAGVTAPTSIGTDDGKLTLMLSGSDAVGCAEVLTELLEVAGIEVLMNVR